MGNHRRCRLRHGPGAVKPASENNLGIGTADQRFFSGQTLRGKNRSLRCPFSGRIKENDKIIDVVQPDISIICDPSKLDERGCLGAPDFIVEIISLSSITKDFIVKTRLYEQNGVKGILDCRSVFRIGDGEHPGRRPEIHDIDPPAQRHAGGIGACRPENRSRCLI